MKKRMLTFLCLILFAVTSCSPKQTTPEKAAPVEKKQEEVKSTEKKDAQPNTESESTKATKNKVGDVLENEYGKFKTVQHVRNLSLKKDSGPFTITVSDLEMATVNPSASTKSIFGNKDEVTMISAVIKVEHKAESTDTIYPDQAILTTNTKEQKDADAFFSESIGGEFIGEVIKEGKVFWVLDSNAKEIKHIKMTIGAPTSSNYDSIGEDVVIEYDFPNTVSDATKDSTSSSTNPSPQSSNASKESNSKNAFKGSNEFHFAIVNGIAVKINERGYTPNGNYYPTKDTKSNTYVNEPPGDWGDIAYAKKYDGFRKEDLKAFDPANPPQ